MKTVAVVQRLLLLSSVAGKQILVGLSVGLLGRVADDDVVAVLPLTVSPENM
jgi:hypothetical protein